MLSSIINYLQSDRRLAAQCGALLIIGTTLTGLALFAVCEYYIITLVKGTL